MLCNVCSVRYLKKRKACPELLHEGGDCQGPAVAAGATSSCSRKCGHFAGVAAASSVQLDLIRKVL